MQAFKNFTGMVAPLDRANVDTDQIIPKQFLKAVVRAGMGKGLFVDWKRNPDGSQNQDFALNKPRFQGASILVARKNFGCGSSREHAVWALEDAGFRAVISSEFADIFHNNCLKNGFLPVTLAPDEVEHIFRATGDYEAYRLTIDLEKQTVSDDFGWTAHFEIEPFDKKCMLEGLDDIALTLAHEDRIVTYEKTHPLPHRFE
jgi:3-isopropylmalate/(R)-2-methylmalate dehydratase small subunit